MADDRAEFSQVASFDSVVAVDFRAGKRIAGTAGFRRTSPLDEPGLAPLHSASQDATYDSMSDNATVGIDRELIDTKLEASEARTDVKFAEVRGEFAMLRGDMAAFRGEVTTALADLRSGMAADRAALMAALADTRSDVALSVRGIDGRIDTVEAAIAAKAAPRDIWLAALAVFGAVLAVLAFGSDRLSLGIGLADQRQEQLARDNAQDEAMRNIGASLQSIDKKVSGR